MTSSRRMDFTVLNALDSTGLPWEIEPGKKHYHIRVGGKLAGILPKGSGTAGVRAVKNCVAQIRRVAREHNDGRDA